MVEDARFTGCDHAGAEGEGDGSGFVPEQLVRELRRGTHLVQERAQTYLDEVLERSRKRTDALVDAIRRQVGNQIAALGIATREDMERLERRLSQPGRSQPGRGQPGRGQPGGGSAVRTHTRERPSLPVSSGTGGRVDGQP